ncbi:hypothetical protein AJ79_07337 [Helicocarpus griseus UAMH5409]|uniref:Uncharacterized protein n=1 Tax=Helicocarpus griseus UAMH5409 TaxID=1447875 RepID=A0A2B7X4K8_9EURO|nr:hypothetical protein AJ79_07337 [Helicocarpus griseus UAMH5409]
MPPAFEHLPPGTHIQDPWIIERIIDMYRANRAMAASQGFYDPQYYFTLSGTSMNYVSSFFHNRREYPLAIHGGLIYTGHSGFTNGFGNLTGSASGGFPPYPQGPHSLGMVSMGPSNTPVPYNPELASFSPSTALTDRTVQPSLHHLADVAARGPYNFVPNQQHNIPGDITMQEEHMTSENPPAEQEVPHPHQPLSNVYHDMEHVYRDMEHAYLQQYGSGDLSASQRPTMTATFYSASPQTNYGMGNVNSQQYTAETQIMSNSQPQNIGIDQLEGMSHGENFPANFQENQPLEQRYYQDSNLSTTIPQHFQGSQYLQQLDLNPNIPANLPQEDRGDTVDAEMEDEPDSTQAENVSSTCGNEEEREGADVASPNLETDENEASEVESDPQFNDEMEEGEQPGPGSDGPSAAQTGEGDSEEMSHPQGSQTTVEDDGDIADIPDGESMSPQEGSE